MKKQDPSFITLMVVISFAAVNAVVFTPGLPMISDYFHITDDTAQLTVTFFLIAYALGQLLYSPFSNRYGRKPALYLGIVIQIISSLACGLSGYFESFTMLLIGRFVAALGSGVGLKMTFTIINEYYEPKVASKKVAYSILAFSIGPALGVALGGLLVKISGWEACFYACAVYGLIVLVLVKGLPETLPERDMNALTLRKIWQDYAEPFKNSNILIGGMMMGCCGSFGYSFSGLAPFIAIDDYGMSPAMYGIVNIIPLVGMLLGGLYSGYSTQKKLLPQIIRFGLFCTLFGVVMMIVARYGSSNIYLSLFIPAAFIYFGTAHILPNASTIALSTVHNKAHASAVINFISMSFVTLILLVISFVTVSPMTLLFGFYMCIATALFVLAFIARARQASA